MKLRTIASAAATLFLAQPALAGVALEANGARADGRWGGELGIGYSLGLDGFSFTPIVGGFVYQGDNDRFYMDDNGGNPRCRDSLNGQYAADSECDNTVVRAYGKVEATYSISLGPELGGGVRVSKGNMAPYGTLAFPLAPMVKLKGNVGDGYYALGLRARF